MIDIIIFAIISGLILKKLFDNLGKIEEDRERFNKSDSSDDSFPDLFGISEGKKADINIVSAYEAGLPPAVREVFDQARAIASSFDAENFISGAKGAFEIIVPAFAQGDEKVLKELLGNHVFNLFKKEIQRRKDAKEMHSTTIVGIREANIIAASLSANILSITVQFVSEQINIVKDELGNVLSGSSDKVEKAEDTWVFAKHLKAYNNNWELVETRS